jgi:hypothetical protein
MKCDEFEQTEPAHHSSPITCHVPKTVAVAGFVPIYSGGTARAFHPLPLPRSHNVGGTIGESDKTCQGPTAAPLVTVRHAVVACARNL